MGHFYDRMDSDLRLARFSESTRKQYLQQARAFVAFHMKPPTELGEAQIREYLHHLVDVCKVSPSVQKMAVAGIKFLFQKTLGRPEEVATIPWPKIPQSMPAILTFSELSRLFEAAVPPLDRAAFYVAFGSGLRISETSRVRIEDINASRGVLRVIGKGEKPRLTLLSSSLHKKLRVYWRIRKPSGPWLFPGKTAAGHISRSYLQRAFRAAADRAQIKHPVTFHAMRHSFSTFLLEAGVDLRVIQALLGHSSIRSTTRYTQVRADFIRKVPCPLDLLHDHLASS